MASRSLLLGVLLLAALPGRARAEGPIVVIPAGAGPALVPTTAVAKALSRRLAPRPPSRAPRPRLVYFAPLPTPPTTLRAKEKQAARLLKKAHSAYELMEYDKVKVDTDEALKIYKELLKGGIADEGYVSCLHLMAASAQLQGEVKEAFRAMNDAFVYDPEPPSKKQFNPSVQELYEQVRVESPGKGTVVLSSTPLGLVWFNGQLHGLARGAARLRAGLYLVRFYAPGYTPTQRWIRVVANQRRELSAQLTPDEAATEDEKLPRLREEGKGTDPGPTINEVATDLEATQLVLVSAGKGCAEARCLVLLRWAKEGRWFRRTKAIYVARQADAAAAALLGLTVPTGPTPAAGGGSGAPATGAACTYDSQCSVSEKCRSGYCVRITPLTRKWWFWTALVVGAAAVSLSIALPLTLRPQPSVIEVR